MFNRRRVSAMLAGTVAAPHFAFAKGAKTQSAFYSGVGNELTHYEVDFATAELARRGSIKMFGRSGSNCSIKLTPAVAA